MKRLGLILFVALTTFATFLLVTDPIIPDPKPVVDPDKPDPGKPDPTPAPDPDHPFGVTSLKSNFAFPADATGATFGIDVSHFQEEINWQQVAESGVAFAFIKALEGVTEPDAKFPDNWKGAQAAGVPFAPYHFFSARTTPEAQAAALLEIIADVPVSALPIALDFEMSSSDPRGWDGRSAAEIANRIDTFIKAVESKRDQKVMIYTVKEWWDERLGSEGAKLLENDLLWIADPRDAALNSGKPEEIDGVVPTFWQFTSKGRVPGIAKDVDISVQRP
ncbi:glycoside hydrolase family 25 protein [uncultured Roseobacter sp.]|uniref:glycoside hydrolase family 25 protein n=1 Tax=uncultured Roseobacter sp. TaxID=114847 RepID=UPI00263A0E96|nr:glycoside hydrolase family 25 protein [uncultured Roseobacter sp.]